MSTAEIISKQNNDKLKCLIVDDEAIAIEGIVDYARKLDFLEVVETCSSALEAIDVLKSREIDVMFLDINMPHLSGLDFLEALDKSPLTILCTAYSEYALDGFRLNVVDYLLKPYTFQQFFRAVQKALDLYRSRLTSDHGKTLNMYIRQRESFQRINWEEILYIEALQNYLKLHFSEKTYIIHQTMVSLEEILPKDYFFRIHNSFLVNINQIESVSGNRLFVGGKELPISKHRKESFFNSIVYKNLISK